MIRSQKVDFKVRAARRAQDAILTQDIKDHRFVVFRLGLDVCAKCQKPRAEHPRD